jgi:hypothetical protein
MLLPGIYCYASAGADVLCENKVILSYSEDKVKISTVGWIKEGLNSGDQVDDIEGLDLRMGTGNEEGANKFYTPGGFTADGQAEAVINPIPKGHYTYESVNY